LINFPSWQFLHVCGLFLGCCCLDIHWFVLFLIFIFILLLISKQQHPKNNPQTWINCQEGSLSTFYNSANQNPLTIRVYDPFFPTITNGVKKGFKQHKIDLVTTSSGYKLKNQLHSTKDMKTTNETLEVYEIKCGTRNCHCKYIGQTRRSAMVRFKEHKSHTTNNHIQHSSVANHMKMKLNGRRRLCGHNFDCK
jgi:hypothetical protein